MHVLSSLQRHFGHVRTGTIGIISLFNPLLLCCFLSRQLLLPNELVRVNVDDVGAGVCNLELELLILNLLLTHEYL